MSRASTPGLLVLHAVRLLGFADLDAIAARAGTDGDTTLRGLRKAEDKGWVQHFTFAGLGGWSLTDAGRSENERQLAAERREADSHGIIPATYRSFLPLNARLVQAVTAWQVKPADDDPLTPNDHEDYAWDSQVLDELAAIGTEVVPLVAQLSDVLERFSGYQTRYKAALHRAVGGERDWIDTMTLDSCHRVWFQLHEDLVATLGIDRHTEGADTQ